MKTNVRLRLLLVAIVLVLPLFAAPASVLADSGSHVVRAGETLYSIGRQYGVNPYDIARLNGLANPNRIYAGQVLRIPGAQAPEPLPVPSPQPAPVEPYGRTSWYGATAICRDGTLSYSQHRAGTCSWHGGVWSWLQPSPVPVPTPTSAPPPAPTPVEPLGRVETTAWVSDPTPLQRSNVTVYGRITRGGVAIAGVPMHATWHYRWTTSWCDAVSGSDGVASCTRQIGPATEGYYVRVGVGFADEGQWYYAYTGFTPQ